MDMRVFVTLCVIETNATDLIQMNAWIVYKMHIEIQRTQGVVNVHRNLQAQIVWISIKDIATHDALNAMDLVLNIVRSALKIPI